MLVENSGAKRRRRRRAVDDDYRPITEIKWESAEDEAKALQICANNIQCQLDFLSTKDESLANATATSEKKFEDDQAVLGKCKHIRIRLECFHISKLIILRLWRFRQNTQIVYSCR